MTRTVIKVLLLAVTTTLIIGLSARADDTDANKTWSGRLASLMAKSQAYAIALEPTTLQQSSERQKVPVPALSSGYLSASPGNDVGYTYWDAQHSGSMGRMVEIGPRDDMYTYPAIVHFGWMYLADSTDLWMDRSYAYQIYDSDALHFPTPPYLITPNDYGGYVNVDVAPDSRAIVGGHARTQNSIYRSRIFFDDYPGAKLFSDYVTVPDELVGYGQVDGGYGMWPKFFCQFGTDTVLHVVALIYDSENPRWLQAMTYFRLVGPESSTGSSDWDFPPYVVDSVPTVSHVVTGVRGGDRVAIVWTANLPYQQPECDTCSGSTVYEDHRIGEMDNDVYYQMSFDQGMTWEPRVNLTQVPIGEAAYKAAWDLSALFDTFSGSLHIIWPACPWPADPCVEEGGFCFEQDWYTDNARLFHWSENVPYLRLITDQVYSYQTELWDSCSAGAWSLRIARPTISECDGHLYTIWTQFNDPRAGMIDDCAQWGYESGYPVGAANGEIYVSVSSNGGLTWDYPRNLTNSYTPHCEPGVTDDCQNDFWASMTRYGRQVEPGEYWGGAAIVDPSGGGYIGDYALDIMYVNDRDAGAVIIDEGSWTYNAIKWFRIPCVQPIPKPVFLPEWTNCQASAYSGVQSDTTLTIANIGNVQLTYTITVEELNGPPGWLEVSGYTGVVNAGLMNTETVTIHLNKDGVITQTGTYAGRLHFVGNDPNNLPMSIDIELWVYPDPNCCEVMGKFYNDGGEWNILDLDNWIEWMLRNPGVPPGPDCPAQLDVLIGAECVWAGNMCIYPDGVVDILDLDAWLECLLRDPWFTPCPAGCPEVP
ncbi:MAG: hypothetical protein JSV52_08575 [Candidatus Zixiibacteriota bacterium]|nr:MAG: hypothetical protein JSV52_08575 [candidate division Zixibacteria bacterium]